MTEFNCGAFVASRIGSLLGKNPASLSPSARGQLAQLRQAAAKAPGTVPAIWAITGEGIPDLPATQRDRVDWAVHTALTMFALHQQSRDRAMHDPDQPFGRAVRLLAQATTARDTEPQESPTYRRFTSMATTKSMTGLATHARGIITQLRGHSIAFDYSQFARDLYWFQVPGSAGNVQRRWGRDFHNLITTDTSEGN